ncbi:ABC1-domain-containing protein [Morchella conica CCBAS932]|uniref:ABC1-domain-containing protein n=1 Tax=Morchella conica CCBAS932 TaxID=1392247 RepID=A0A3N4KYQ2_9PEZI|nr:ABC1-domain-containing protein [Morchella conica CCBAS932]
MLLFRGRPPPPTHLLTAARSTASTPRVTGFVPPSPESLGKPRIPRKSSPRLRKYGRRLAYTTALGTTLYLADRFLNYSTFTRNFRTLGTCTLIALDYKLNFAPSKSSRQLSRLHERSADRLLDLCLTNGGLYQKMGQAIAMQSAVLPPVFQAKFSQFFDETPQAGWKEVEKVLREEYGHLPEVRHGTGELVDRIFMPGTWERKAIGSASVAQVHRARLKTGEWVAVKVQKPWIERQVGLDLWMFESVSYFFSEKLFALPLSYFAPYISARLFQETDFINEANNATLMRDFVLSEPSLRNKVHIPLVYPHLSTRRILVTEWIDGVPVSARPLLTGPYRGPAWIGHTPTTPYNQVLSEGPLKKYRPPPSGPPQTVYGLGLRERDIMQIMVDLFCAQMFMFGSLHCDPHPGNILIRRTPAGRPELVLLDHGLYISTTPEFRRQYAEFWRALFTFDNATIQRVASQWGIANADLFASATLLRPYTGGSNDIADIVGEEGSHERGGSAFAAHEKMREKMGAFLEDQEKMPKELIFIGRNMRIVQANNQALGSPVNRIKIIALWASRSLTRFPAATGGDGFFKGWLRHLVFKVVVLGLDIVFWYGRVRQALLGGAGFEERLEERMRRVAMEELGVELNHGVFEG